jgi:predicted amidohydrolase YtcJ
VTASDALILHGGAVLTMDDRASTAGALALADGRIVGVGERDELVRSLGRGARCVDLEGATVIPGLVDTHPHLMHFGVLAEPLVDLADARSGAEIGERIARRARETPSGEWIMASPVGEPHYFIRRSYRDLQEGVLPDRLALDEATSSHPVMIQAWAPVTPNVCAFNTAALRELGIGAATPERVSNVWIEKDGEGQPTGRLSGSVNNYYSDDPFMNDLLGRLKLFDPAAIGPGTRRAMSAYNALGVTTVYEGHAMDFALIEAYRWLRSENALTVRVLTAPEAELYGQPADRPLSIEQFDARLRQALSIVDRSDELLRIDGLTVSRGGPCWPGFLLMREPYSGPYGEQTTGRSFVSSEKAERAISFCADRGLRLNLVSAGLAEHDEYLEQLERLAASRSEARRWILQHGYFLTERQARGFAAAGFDATTSMSFSWGKGELFSERIGDHVLGDLIPLKRLLQSGMRVGCGSDWGPKNIFEQIRLAITHEFAASGRRNDGPAQAVDRRQALEMWTREAARVLDWQGIGVLAPGFHADLAILDRDPLSCPLEDLPGTKVLATYLAGEVVHDTGFMAGK